MRTRRGLLATLGVGAVSLTGCLGGSDDDVPDVVTPDDGGPSTTPAATTSRTPRPTPTPATPSRATFGTEMTSGERSVTLHGVGLLDSVFVADDGPVPTVCSVDGERVALATVSGSPSPGAEEFILGAGETAYRPTDRLCGLPVDAVRTGLELDDDGTPIAVPVPPLATDDVAVEWVGPESIESWPLADSLAGRLSGEPPSIATVLIRSPPVSGDGSIAVDVGVSNQGGPGICRLAMERPDGETAIARFRVNGNEGAVWPFRFDGVSAGESRTLALAAPDGRREVTVERV
ncbi:hypothetical protein BRD17_03700 [Halobacteriales archaeon SW_7_68_16]|nr:MAG: hypothetical protein BRD17_03700 [Halobacteriales archaeon SW_7_68_16]